MHLIIIIIIIPQSNYILKEHSESEINGHSTLITSSQHIFVCSYINFQTALFSFPQTDTQTELWVKLKLKLKRTCGEVVKQNWKSIAEVCDLLLCCTGIDTADHNTVICTYEQLQ